MTIRSLFGTGLFLVFLILFPQASIADLVLPGDHFVQGWAKEGAERRFVKSDLFNYINGAADLFMDFGFEKVLVQKYINNGQALRLEVFEMTTPAASLGIYLMKCGKETPIEGIPSRNSGNPFQIKIVKGAFFIQVSQFEGNREVLPDMARLARGLLGRLPEEGKVPLLDSLPREALIKGTGRILLGPHALQTIFTFGKGNILQINGRAYGVCGEYAQGKKERQTNFFFFYPTSKMARAAFRNLLANLDPHLTVLEEREDGFLFEDFQNKFGKAALQDRIIRIEIHLSKRPGVSPEKR